MSNLSTETKPVEHKTTKEEYNNSPVLYCVQCLSLRVRQSDNIDYCDECGGTEIEEIHIQEWEKMYEQKYGKNYLTGK